MQANRRLDFDFSRVRIHHEEAAGRSALDLRANAYAISPHVVFAPGRYRPETPAGQALLLHELGHIRQQPERSSGGPLLVGASPSHERNASLLASGQTSSAQALPGNVIACDSQSGYDPFIAALQRQSPQRQQTGILDNGAIYTVQRDGTVAVNFPARSSGQVLLDDPGDEPERLNLPKTKEIATQVESKKVVAVNTPVRAVFEAKNINFDNNGNPVSIAKYKPIELEAHTGYDNARLIQQEKNTTILSPESDPEQKNPSTVININKDKSLQGDISIKKGPAQIGDSEFKKLETQKSYGTVNEKVVSTIEYRRTGSTVANYEDQDFTGSTSASRGIAEKKEGEERGVYVSDKVAQGRTKQQADKGQHFNLASGRVLQIDTHEDKNANQTKNDKKIKNYGFENLAKEQTENKDKAGKERAAKKVSYDIYAKVPVDSKNEKGATKLIRQGESLFARSISPPARAPKVSRRIRAGSW